MQAPPPNAADSRLTPQASWLYWVAAMSAINTIIHMSGGTWTFALGLGLTEFLTGAGNALGPMAKTITLCATAAVLALMVFLGYMACRGAVWAFIAGGVLLSIDTLLLVPFASTAWLSIAIHIWAVISLFMGAGVASRIQKGTYMG